MGPRANFECKTCQTTHEDLPVESVRCPISGHKRGFKRLFDGVQVGGHRDAAKMVDKYAVQALEQVRRGAPNYNPDFRSQTINAQAAVGMVGQGVADSRQRNIPTLMGLGNLGGPRPGPGSRAG